MSLRSNIKSDSIVDWEINESSPSSLRQENPRILFFSLMRHICSGVRSSALKVGDPVISSTEFNASKQWLLKLV